MPRVCLADSAVTQTVSDSGELAVHDCIQSENVYSFYLDRPGGAARSFACEWIVGMTDKDTHGVRFFGCGRYHWDFQDTPPRLARSLAIQISAICVQPAVRSRDVLARLERLAYPLDVPKRSSCGASR